MSRTARQDLESWGKMFRNRKYNENYFYLHSETISNELYNIILSLGCRDFNTSNNTKLFSLSREEMKQALDLLEVFLD